MSSELLVHSAHALDDATENLTFDEFTWAFEDAWLGAAWALSALLGWTLARETVFDDTRPRPGALAQLLAQVGAPLPSAPLPVAKVVGILMPDGLTRSIGGSSIEAS